jgi:hypothetical protein
MDEACFNQGPVGVPGDAESRKYAGGVYIDLDRSKLGASENLILHLTYLPLGPTHQRPDGQTYSPSESAIFRVNLVKNNQELINIQSTQQPRHLTYYGDENTPVIVQSLSVTAPPDGSVRQDQVLIPLAATDSSVNRIHIQRVSGSAILIDATLLRTSKAP